MSEPKPYAVCLVDFNSGEDLKSFETFDVPSFGDILQVQNAPGGPLKTYEVLRIVRQVTVTYGNRTVLRAVVSVADRDEDHRSTGERDRASMADTAVVVRDLLGYGTFDLGDRACWSLSDRQEALGLLRALVPSEERDGVADLLRKYLNTKGPP